MSDNIPSAGLQLQRAVFLRGVSDPVENARITTVFYRPRHLDLRYRDGFVQAGPVSVPVSNVVEMITMLGNTIVSATFDAEEQPATQQEPVVEEDKPFRRRGRPRKNPVG